MVRKKPVILRPIRENAAIELAYRKKLTALTDEMRKSVKYWITTRYGRQEARITNDASPAFSMATELKRLIRRWERKFSDTADHIAKWFADKNNIYTKQAMLKALKDAGFTVEPRNTRRVNDLLRAVIESNAGLIKSIPAQYLDRVQSAVNLGVMNGRDLGGIVAEIDRLGEVTHKRAVMIARDQSNKATNAMTRARYEDLGIVKAVWQHNAGGSMTFRDGHLTKSGKATDDHVSLDGKVFDLAKGMYDPFLGRNIQPGECVNCKCSYRPYLPEFGSVGKDEEEARGKEKEQAA
jgi:uncharacterized protein with gpF-like domain